MFSTPRHYLEVIQQLFQLSCVENVEGVILSYDFLEKEHYIAVILNGSFDLIGSFSIIIGFHFLLTSTKNNYYD